MLNQTKAAQNIINAIEESLVNNPFVSCPEVYMACIMDEVQELVAKGYMLDVALAKAATIYRATKHCGVWAYRD